MAFDVAREIYELALLQDAADKTIVRMEFTRSCADGLEGDGGNGIEGGSNDVTGALKEKEKVSREFGFEKRDGTCMITYGPQPHPMRVPSTRNVLDVLCQIMLQEMIEATGDFVADIHYLDVTLYFYDEKRVFSRYVFENTMTLTDVTDYKTWYSDDRYMSLQSFLHKFFNYSDSLVLIQKTRRSRFV